MFPTELSERRPHIPSDLKRFSDVIQRLTGHSTIIDYIQKLEEEFEPEILQIGTAQGRNIEYLLSNTSTSHIITIHPNNPHIETMRQKLIHPKVNFLARNIQIYTLEIDELLIDDTFHNKFHLIIVHNGRLTNPLNLATLDHLAQTHLRQDGIILASGVSRNNLDDYESKPWVYFNESQYTTSVGYAK